MVETQVADQAKHIDAVQGAPVVPVAPVAPREMSEADVDAARDVFMKQFGGIMNSEGSVDALQSNIPGISKISFTKSGQLILVPSVTLGDDPEQMIGQLEMMMIIRQYLAEYNFQQSPARVTGSTYELPFSSDFTRHLHNLPGMLAYVLDELRRRFDFLTAPSPYADRVPHAELNRQAIELLQQGKVSEYSALRSQNVVYWESPDLKQGAFYGLDLTGADFSGADLTNVKFHHTNLANANFSFAKLQRAEFNMADLTGATFLLADLSDASLWNAKGLVSEQFQYMKNFTGVVVTDELHETVMKTAVEYFAQGMVRRGGGGI